MVERAPTGTELWLMGLPPTRRQTRWVVAVVVCQFAALAAVAPFAGTPLARFDSFIPAFNGLIFVTDLVTSVLLFAQFAIHRLRALLILACGYLFTALIVIPHALTFPDAFSPTGLLGAGLQTAGWLYWFWHVLFPLALLGYGLTKDQAEPGSGSSLAVIGRSIVLIVVLTCGLTLLTTAGNDYLPSNFNNKLSLIPSRTVLMGGLTTLMCVSALAVLWLRRRSLLDQWLMVVALAAILEAVLGVILISERFSLGWYAGRVFSLLTSTIVLIVLMAETTRLYANVRELNESLEKRVQAETHERLQVWNVSQDLLVVADLDGKYINVNPAWTATLGWSESDLLSKPSQWFRHPDDREKTRAEINQLARGLKTRHFENRLRAKDGSYRWISWAAAPNGGRIYGMGRDVTDQKRAEDALRESEARFRDYAETASDWLWETGPDHKLTLSSGNALGVRPTARLGIAPWEAALDVEAEPEKWRVIRAALDSRKPFRDFVYLVAGSGDSGMYVKTSGKPVFDTNGEFRGYRGTGTDVTAIVRAQEALRQSEQQLRSAIDGIPGLVAILASHGEVESVNRQIVDYCGQPLEELKNWGTNGIVHREDLPQVVDVFTKSIASGIPYHFEARLRRFDGEYRWFDVRGIPVRDASDRVARWYSLLTDIEDRTRALMRLQQMQSDFAHMNRVSTMGELTASLSHEILHPIATARNNARAGMRFLEMNPPNLDEVKEALGCVVRDADRAKEIVGRVRAHIKKTPPRREPVDLNDAVREALVMVRSTLARNRISVNTDLMDTPISVQGDSVQLQQVIVNLILNAVEAMSSEEQGVKALSIRTDQGQVDSGVLVQIQDSGPGIGSGNVERVFDPFYTTKNDGVGMGLSICRSIINAHGGQLWAAANEPRGAVFQFTLPPAQEDS